MAKKNQLSLVSYYFPSCAEKKLSPKEVAYFNKMFDSKNSNIIIEEEKKIYSSLEWERKIKRERNRLLKEVSEIFQCSQNHTKREILNRSKK